MRTKSELQLRNRQFSFLYGKTDLNKDKKKKNFLKKKYTWGLLEKNNMPAHYFC